MDSCRSWAWLEGPQGPAARNSKSAVSDGATTVRAESRQFGTIQFYGFTQTVVWWPASLSAQLLIAEEVGRGTASSVPVWLEQNVVAGDDDNGTHLAGVG